MNNKINYYTWNPETFPRMTPSLTPVQTAAYIVACQEYCAEYANDNQPDDIKDTYIQVIFNVYESESNEVIQQQIADKTAYIEKSVIEDKDNTILEFMKSKGWLISKTLCAKKYGK